MNPGELAALRRNIYIDVDGVCLRSASSSLTGIEPAPHCFAFLQWAVEFHRPHWLTTRDAHGQHDGILRAFKLAMDCATLPTDVDALVRWGLVVVLSPSGSPLAGTAAAAKQP